MADEKNNAPFDPAGLMEKAFLMGVGVLDITKEKTEAFASDLIERGKMSQSDAKKVADRVGEMAETQQEAVRRTVAAETEKAMRGSGVATKSEVDELKAQIAELKSMLERSSGVASAVEDEVAPPSYPDE
jgi:polyhydroxyalkanoate synthesis regulator phasin